MKKYECLALLLALCLALSLFAGCAAKTETPAAETPAAEEPAAETPAAEEPAASADEPAPAQEAPAEQPEPAQEAPAEAPAQTGFVDGKYVSPEGIAYPCGDGTDEITYFKGYNAVAYLPSQNDFPILPLLLEQTGVNYVFKEVSNSAESEQFQLMVASGDYTDIISGSSYTGGAAQAWLDEIIIDLTDMIAVDAPDYWKMADEKLSDIMKEAMYTTTDSGDKLLLGMTGISESTLNSEGYAVRGDWLEELGFTAQDLTLLDGFTDALYAAYDKYGCQYTWFLDHYTGTQTKMVNCPAFGTAFADLGMRGSSLNLYLEDGKVTSAWTSDGYRSYVEWFHQLYADQIIGNDFYQHSEWSMPEINALIGTGETFCWLTGADWISDCQSYVDASFPDFRVQPIGQILEYEGQENNWKSEGGGMGGPGGGGNISATCKDPDLVVQYMNFFFTQPGILSATYGTEGETYTIDDEGKPAFTDVILHNDMEVDGEAYSLTPQRAIQLYTATFVSTYTSTERAMAVLTDDGKNAIDVWAIDYASGDCNIPTTCTLTTSEQESITNESSDVISYGSEMILKYMTGTEALTDESWNAYVQAMDGFGIQHCLEVWQTAYDAYLATH